MNLLPIITTIFYVSAASTIAKRLPESLSESAYIWEEGCQHNFIHKARLFSIYCAIMCGMLFWPWWCAFCDYTRFLSISGCMGILAAGATPFFRGSWQKPVHYTGGCLAMVSWVAWMCSHVFWQELATCTLLFGVGCIMKKKSWVLWGELAGLLGLCVCI